MEFEAACIGPAHGAAVERLARAQKRESARFVHDYNDRIFNGLVIASLADILVFRFLVRISLLETVGWVAFAFLQARTRLYAFTGCQIWHVRWSHLAWRLSFGSPSLLATHVTTCPAGPAGRGRREWGQCMAQACFRWTFLSQQRGW